MRREPLGANKGKRAHTNQKRQGVRQNGLEKLGILAGDAHGGKTNSQRLRREHLAGGDAQRVQGHHLVGVGGKRLGRLALHLAKQHTGTGAGAGDKSADHTNPRSDQREERTGHANAE